MIKGWTDPDKHSMIDRLLIYGIFTGLFLEGEPYSVMLLGVRLRISLVLAMIGIAVIAYRILKSGILPRFETADKFLWVYLGINIISIVMSPDMPRSIKIAVLLGSLILLYHLIVILTSKPKLFDEAFKVFLFIGLIQIGFGLYQVAAGMVRYYFGWIWPIGHLGVFQARFSGAPWGRPYGTLYETDWYGAVCLFFSVVFIVLALSRSEKNRFFFFGAGISLTGLLFSLVRGAWLGFFAAVVFLIIFGRKAAGLTVRPVVIFRVLAAGLVLFSLIYMLSPSVQTIVQMRFFPSNEKEKIETMTIRYLQAKGSWDIFKKSPILGHGPGMPSRIMSFNHSIIMTALVDTGIVGLTILLAWLAVFFRDGLRKISTMTPARQPAALGLLAGIVGVFVSYIFTTGLWIPFTWVFLGLFIAAVRASISHTESA